MLRERYPQLQCSSVYESEAVGFAGDNFLNLAACVQSDDSIASINAFLKNIENDLGRDRSQAKFSARPMDIDILTYGELLGEQQGINLPREEIEKHAFVLQPLAELLPDQMHLLSNKSFAAMWAEFDKESQKLWVIDFDWQD